MRACHAGGVILFIREDVPAMMLSTRSTNDSEGLFAELNFWKNTFLLCCSYNLQKSKIFSYPFCLREILDMQMTKYDNFLIVGNFNSELSESVMCIVLRRIIW